MLDTGQEGGDASRCDILTIDWGAGEGGTCHQLRVTKSNGVFEVLLDEECTGEPFPVVLFRKSLDWKRLMQVHESERTKTRLMHQLRDFVGDDKICFKLFGILPKNPEALMPFLIQ